jgi:hypothetical protein
VSVLDIDQWLNHCSKSEIFFIRALVCERMFENKKQANDPLGAVHKLRNAVFGDFRHGSKIVIYGAIKTGKWKF